MEDEQGRESDENKAQNPDDEARLAELAAKETSDQPLTGDEGLTEEDLKEPGYEGDSEVVPPPAEEALRERYGDPEAAAKENLPPEHPEQ